MFFPVNWKHIIRASHDGLPKRTSNTMRIRTCTAPLKSFHHKGANITAASSHILQDCTGDFSRFHAQQCMLFPTLGNQVLGYCSFGYLRPILRFINRFDRNCG